MNASTEITNKTIWFAIVNPTAGGGKAGEQWEKMFTKFSHHKIDIAFEKTTHKNHATELTQLAIQKGFRQIIAVGGDGTANEVANGILLQKVVPPNNITFALLPIGTGNDWIKTHGIPKDIDMWIDRLKRQRVDYQDVGVVNCYVDDEKITRYFINVAGMAFDAFVTKASEGKARYLFPKLQFLMLTLKCLWKYRLTSAQLFFDKKEVVDDFYTINIGICKYSGGGMQLVPHAVPNDGQLALTYVGKASKWNVLFNSWRFYGGHVLSHSKTRHFQIKNLRVESRSKEQTGVEVDGEYIGETPVDFSILPNALKIIV